MRKVGVLDCTLRDGGRIIDCNFSDNDIREMISRLADAKVDVIEVGFLRDKRDIEYKGNSTFFTDIKQISEFIDKNKKNTTYAVFVDFGMCDIDSLAQRDEKSVDAIRLGFTKNDYVNSRSEIIRWAKTIIDRGYMLYVQTVNSLAYSSEELVEVIDTFNDIHPYSFGIVDTYGAMYPDDVNKIYHLIDRNLNNEICINFHSHNNLQLSFALAQEVIKLSRDGSRKVLIDGTIGGMGKAAGNLNTELLINFMTKKYMYDYEFEDILDIYDDYIYKYYVDKKWGYSIAAMLAGEYRSHPNNIIYLTEKFRLNTKDIGRLLSMIPPDVRQRYDYDCIEKLYTEYIADKVDDHDAISELREKMEGKEVMVLSPGVSLNKYKKEIDDYIGEHDPVLISINFIDKHDGAFAFFGNSKRYNRLKKSRKNRVVIVSSNIQSDGDDYVIDYYTLINRENKCFENSTIMLLNALKRIRPSHIILAGFDGFDKNKENNFMDDSFQNDRHLTEFNEINDNISKMVNEIIDTMSPDCRFSLLTPTVYNLKI